ncbi:hypothetical protein HDU93_002800, partial [Gonapodya sp. JEL0774]
WSFRSSVGALIGLVVIGVALELAVYYSVKVSSDRGLTTAVNVIGVIPLVFALAGFLPQYWEFWRLKRVIGISLLFSLIDGSGGLFNGISVAFRPPPFDVVAFLNFFLITVAQAVTWVCFLWYEVVRKGRGKGPSVGADREVGSFQGGSADGEERGVDGSVKLLIAGSEERDAMEKKGVERNGKLQPPAVSHFDLDVPAPDGRDEQAGAGPLRERVVTDERIESRDDQVHVSG